MSQTETARCTMRNNMLLYLLVHVKQEPFASKTCWVQFVSFLPTRLYQAFIKETKYFPKLRNIDCLSYLFSSTNTCPKNAFHVNSFIRERMLCRSKRGCFAIRFGSLLTICLLFKTEWIASRSSNKRYLRMTQLWITKILPRYGLPFQTIKCYWIFYSWLA